ncbi:MAG: PD-(D/E)XK nuclease family protein [Pseudomonadota bacterium]
MTSAQVFAIPPGADFARSFAQGYVARHVSAGPYVTARTQILVTTTLAREEIETALADAMPSPGVLPRLELIPDLAADPLLAPDLPPSVRPMRRHFRLTRLVERFLEARAAAGEPVAPVRAAADLAAELAFLMDQMHDAGLGAEALDNALEGSELGLDVAHHWTEMRRFLDLVCTAWPAIRAEAEGDLLDPRERQRLLIDHLTEEWATDPPEHPVLAVGSTGSVASTARLLASVARLPKGQIVLPGLDPEVDDGVWSDVTDDHPLGPFQGLLHNLAMTPAQVRPWIPVVPSRRRTLLAQALRPAPVTDHWYQAGEKLRGDLTDALDGFSVLEAESPRAEAEAIAVATRAALEVPGKRVTIISSDAMLARRVTAALSAFGIVPDDTMGQPLLLSAPGRLLSLAVDAAEAPDAAVTLVGLLQHPLVFLGLERQSHLQMARAFEAKVLRKPSGWQTLPPWPDAGEAGRAWHGALLGALEPLASALAARKSLGSVVAAHVETLERLTARPDGPAAAWQGEAGRELSARLAGIARDAGAFGPGAVQDYRAVLRSLLSDAQLRPRPREPHPRVTIRGTREARFVQADLTILTGLNEGSWPQTADPGPWLGRPMREAVGIPSPERSVGLSAHDFLQAACRDEVLLTRARKADGAATVASRWLIRLETLVVGVGGQDAWSEALTRGARYSEYARRFAAPIALVERARRPRANPPPEARPRVLSVTRIELLVRDAYAVYAHQVLGLRPMDPLGRPPDMRDRGSVMHRVLERFVAQSQPWPGSTEARALLQQIADGVLAEDVPWKDLQRVWRARIGRFADWFVREEEARRAGGHPLAVEVSGRMTIDLPGGPFEIRAKADRVDHLHDGSAAIYDYKTGDPPSKKQIDAGFNHQLHIQAAILAAGGFCGLDAAVVAQGAYIGLTGRGNGGVATNVPELSEGVAGHMANVRRLLSAYDAGAPYISHPRPMNTAFAGDYDHLARVAEWRGEEEV